MAESRLAVAQRGIALADAVRARPAAGRARGVKGARGARGAKAAKAGARARGIGPNGGVGANGKAGAGAKSRAALVGPFLSPGSLSNAERLLLIDGIERVLEGVYAHLPLKRARYGFDPIQRLRILRSQANELTDEGFHLELADAVTRLRDAHTRYVGPNQLADKVAALPFLVEMFGSADAPTYVVTKVGRGLDAAFKPGVVLEYWNGVPIDRAVQRHGDEEVGGRPDSQRAWSIQSLTLRSLQYGPPPDEHWVVIGYRTVPADGGAGQAKEIKIPWQVVDPTDIETPPTGEPTGKKARALRLARAVDPAAEAVRRAKMLLFAPHALVGDQAPAPSAPRFAARRKPAPATIIETTLTETLKAMSIDAPGGPFGYLRIYGFDTEPDAFIDELVRLIPLLPDAGLIIDVRGNPGGYILASEFALQLFTPNRIEPTRFSPLATPFTRQMSATGDVGEDLAPWKASLGAAVRNGEAYAQTIPISDPDDCNALGQHYGGPVVLVGDSTTYSAGDLFSAGFVDNAIGPFLCVGAATGAGGANVWNYSELRQALAGSAAALPKLPDGIDLSFAFRRATRARASEGLLIEDVGVAGTPYALTRNDLLNGNPDLIAACVAVLKQQPFSRLSASVDKAARAILVSTSGLDRLDTLIDGHPGSSQPLAANGSLSITYAAGTKIVELTGFSGDEVRQRRRLQVRR